MKGLLLVSLAAALWGTVGVGTRLMTGDPPLDPALAGMIRTALGAAFLLTIAGVLGVPRPAWRRLPLRLLSLFGLAGAVFQICLFAAFAEVGVTVTVAVTVAGPAALVVVGDAAWNRRLPEAAVLAAVAVAVAGVLVAVAGGHRPAGPPTVAWRGAALLLGAACAFALVAAAARGLGAAMHPLRGAGLGLVATALTLVAMALVSGHGPGLESLAAMPTRDLAILCYTGLFATGVAYLAFVLGMQLCRSPSVGIAPTLIEPGVAALLAALVLRERLSPLETTGCGLMLAAIAMLALCEWRGPRRDDTARSPDTAGPVGRPR